jgi:drug/metabolite transporter (DMT)-like permease
MRDTLSRTRSPALDLPALGALLLLSAIWGYNFVVMKEVLIFVDPFDFTAARTFLGALALFAFAAATGRRLPMPHWKPMVLLGFLQTAAFGALIQWALVSGEAGRTVVVVYSMPFWLVALAAVFLGERIGLGPLAAILAAAVGLGLILQPWAGGTLARDGAVLAMLAGLIWALSAVIARKSPRRAGDSLLALTAWQMLFGAFLLGLIVLILPAQPLTPAPYFWGALAYSSILATGVAWFLWLYILERMSAGAAGLSTLLVPVVGLTAGWLQLGERPDGTTAIGMALILVALAMLSVLNIRGRA